MPETRTWTSESVADAFVSFFRERGHLQLPSSSLVPEDDPTVLLTTAGVQQMIPYMLGQVSPPAPRLVSVQKCFRTTDIDSVGDRHHLTFFEMLGNFSIGDYFKEQVIPWAWELVTERYGIPADKVWVTVHPTDDEARRIWQAVGLPNARIVVDESNFWGPPGASGPCGPDTEIYVDRGPDYACGRADCGPLCECSRYLEIWNLVFNEFFQDTSGARTPLAQQNVDTGSGLERVTAILQHAPSVYETDLFLPIIQGIERITGARYGESERLDYSLRVLADHGRAMTFLVGDGVKPSNEGRGYVLRRIIRRAARYGQRLGLQRPFLADVVELVINRMAARYPALASPSQRVQIAEIVRTEERRFLTTLQSGLGLLDRWIEEAKAAGQTELAGERIFQLYDTYGFPKELSEEIASEAGLSIGGDAYDRAMAEQRARSRGAIDQRTRLQRRVGEASELLSQPPTVFLGYDRLDTGSEILAIQADGADAARLHEGDRGSVVLAETPFYAEGGGQVGDTGHIVTPSGIFRVEDTQKDGAGHYLHVGQVEHGEVLVGEAADAAVDPDRRYDIMRHHSATHLLHKSLQTILGPKAVQAGSLVSPQLARFDFPNEGPVSAEQLAQIEDLVNREILEDLPVHIEELPFQEAVGQGASAFFGEKYGERVRVVTMGDFSKELCGGTHVRRTGELGAAYVLAESGIGSGMRRIEVVAGRAAHELARARSRQVESVAARLGTSPQRLEERVESLLAELREVRREAARMEAQLADVQAASLGQGVETVGSATVMAARVDAQSMDALLQMMDAARRAHESGVIVLAAVIGGKPQFVIGVSKDLIRPGFDAVALLRHVAAPTGGSGGGRPELARGGGQDASKLDEALGLVAPFVREHLGQ